MPVYGIVNVDRLNLREEPNTSARILQVLKRDTVLEVLTDSTADWLQVRVDGADSQGFVSRGFVRLTATKPEAGIAGQKGEVTARALNLRAGPSTIAEILTTLSLGTAVEILESQGDWLKIRAFGREGYVAAQFITTGPTLAGYFIEEPELMAAPLTPGKVIPAQRSGTEEAVIAFTWNSYGGLMQILADLLSIPAGAIVAVLAAESGGAAFGVDGRLIIRFENHIFFNYWGSQNPEIFNRFFTFDRTSAARGWRGHQFRPDTNQPYQEFHGSQSREWEVFEFARHLNEEAAMLSISMGAPQIMGFNYKRLGYESVQEMFFQFSNNVRAQILGVFDFVKGPEATSPAIRALQRGDYLIFASIYNGTANAQVYRDRIVRYLAIYSRLIKTAVNVG